MAGFLTGRAKRKEPEEVYDDFSYFSLSSPATKIRRLVRRTSCWILILFEKKTFLWCTSTLRLALVSATRSGS